MTPVAPYVLATCCPNTQTVFDESGAVRADLVAANVDEHCAQIAQAARDHGARLIVFPEFSLSGYAMVGPQSWHAAALAFPGPETARIAAAARAAGAYVVIQAAERHPAIPGRYFLSAAILTPQGEMGLVYRKHYALSLRTSPNDVHDSFVAAFGSDAFYPVLDTPLGRIGIVIGAEVHWPEATRSLVLKGAEILVNPVAAPTIDYLYRAGANAVRGVRAFENVAYLAMANIGGGDAPQSEVYDYHGAAIGVSAGAGGGTVATIDLAALRHARAQIAANLVAQIQPAIHEDLRAMPLWPANAFADRAPHGFDELGAVERATWERMQAAGRG